MFTTYSMRRGLWANVPAVGGPMSVVGLPFWPDECELKHGGESGLRNRPSDGNDGTRPPLGRFDSASPVPRREMGLRIEDCAANGGSRQ